MRPIYRLLSGDQRVQMCLPGLQLCSQVSDQYIVFYQETREYKCVYPDCNYAHRSAIIQKYFNFSESASEGNSIRNDIVLITVWCQCYHLSCCFMYKQEIRELVLHFLRSTVKELRFSKWRPHFMNLVAEWPYFALPRMPMGAITLTYTSCKNLIFVVTLSL